MLSMFDSIVLPSVWLCGAVWSLTLFIHLIQVFGDPLRMKQVITNLVNDLSRHFVVSSEDETTLNLCPLTTAN